MDGIKGIHALFTFLFIISLSYFGYSFVNEFFSAIQEDLVRYIFWATYFIIIIVTGVVVPLLIVTAAPGVEAEANIISAVSGLGTYFLGVFFITILAPIINMFITPIGVSSTAILEGDTLGIGFMSILFILGVLFALVLLPVVVATMPSLTVKKIGDAL